MEFDLILYDSVNNFSVMLGQVFLGVTSTKQGSLCIAHGHNTVAPVRLEPATLLSPVKHSTEAILSGTSLFAILTEFGEFQP